MRFICLDDPELCLSVFSLQFPSPPLFLVLLYPVLFTFQCGVEVCVYFMQCCCLFASQRSVDLNPAQHDLVLKVAELLCSKPEHDSRAEFWVEKAARLLPGYPAVFNLRVSVS